MTVPTLTSFTGQLPDYGDPASFDSRMFALRTWHLDTFNPELQAIVAAFNTDVEDFNADYGNFDVLYLGPKASAPSLDNQGNALIAGARYWDTTTQGEFVWNGSAWISTAYNSANVAITGGSIDGVTLGATSAILSAVISGDLTVDTSTLYVDSTNKRVGIGTASPDVPLKVVHDSGTDTYGVTVSAESNAALSVLSSASPSRIALTTQSNVSTIKAIGGTGESTLTFETGPLGSPTEAARIDSSGNLLVGTTAVSTDPGVQIYGTGPIYTHISGTATQAQMRFYRASSIVGSITTDGTSTAYNTSSDYRLKEDWQPLTGASERVLALKPVNFAWKSDGSRVDGFLAHEAQAVVPEAVHGEKDAVDEAGSPVYQGIDQSKLVPLLTAALRDEIQNIRDLQARVAVLEAA